VLTASLTLAHEMPVEYDPKPERFRGAGIVYLAFNDEDGKYGGYWDLGQPSPAALEDFPRDASAAAAVRWGRERTPRVLIRPESDPSRTYWAGAGPPTGEFEELPVWDESADLP
jgi:hypothetical protein